DVVLLRGMHGHFCWRQSEDQPTASNINIGKTQHVPQKCAVRLGIGAVNDRVGARNHVRLDPATAKTARRKFLDCVIAANLFELGGPIVLQLERRLTLPPFRSFLRGRRTRKVAPGSSSLEFRLSTASTMFPGPQR